MLPMVTLVRRTRMPLLWMKWLLAALAALLFGQANATVLFSEDFNGPTNLDPQKWAVKVAGGDPNSPYYGTSHPAAISFTSGRMNAAVPGGANGYMGIPDGSVFTPVGATVTGDYEVTIGLEELFRQQTDGYKDNSGVGLAAGDRYLAIHGNYSGYFTGYSYNTYNKHRIQGYGPSGNCVLNESLGLTTLYAVELRISRVGGNVKMGYRIAGQPWVDTPCGTQTGAVSPYFQITSGDGGGTSQNGQFTAAVDYFQITDAQTSTSGTFTASSLDGYSIADIAKVDGNTWILASLRTTPQSFIVNGDGNKAYLSDVYLLKIDASNNLSKVKLAALYPLGESPTYDGGGLLVEGSTVYAFQNSLAAAGTYAMNGYQYTVNAQSMNITSTRPVFSYDNWGWYPVVQTGGKISHFSFAGYYRMNESVNAGYVDPSVMNNEAIQNHVAHASSLFTADELTKINSTFRTTLIQRLMAAQPQPVVRGMCPAAYPTLDYATNSLCIPSANVPQPNGGNVTFYTAWKAADAKANGAVFYLTDATQLADTNNPTANYETATGQAVIPSLYTLGSNNGTDGYSAQRYQLVANGDLLGLTRVVPTAPAPTPQACATQAVSWTVNSQTCQASTTAMASGQTSTISSTNGKTGAASFVCTNGTWGSAQSATCEAPAPVTPPAPTVCTAQTLTWAVGTASCSGAAAQANAGGTASVSSANGSAVFSCGSNGTWASIPNAGASCVVPVVTPPPPTGCVNGVDSNGNKCSI